MGAAGELPVKRKHVMGCLSPWQAKRASPQKKPALLPKRGMKNPYVYTIHSAPDEPGAECVARAVRAAASRLNPRVVMSFEGVENLRSVRRLEATDKRAESKMQRDAFKEFRGSGGNTSAQRDAVRAMQQNVARRFTFVTEIRVVECASYDDAGLAELPILGIMVPVRATKARLVGLLGAREARESVRHELYTPSYQETLDELFATAYDPVI